MLIVAVTNRHCPCCKRVWTTMDRTERAGRLVGQGRGRDGANPPHSAAAPERRVARKGRLPQINPPPVGADRGR
jgi:hypothetical protein